MAILSRKKNIRLLDVPGAHRPAAAKSAAISGGAAGAGARQDRRRRRRPGGLDAGRRRRRRREHPGGPAFAWRACRAVKSNAILLADDRRASGSAWARSTGVDSCHSSPCDARPATGAAGAVAASDAFFPFADGLQTLIDAGVRAVVQPGGSVRDAEVVAAASAAGMTMYFTGTRHFFH